MKPLRHYQRESIDALYRYWVEGNKGHGLIVVPTGGGKSLIMAHLIREIVEDYKARVLILTHVRELVSQDYNELMELWPEAPAGVYSAGLKRKELQAPILFASVQSLDGHETKLDPAPEIVLIDEAHLIPRSQGTRYVRVLNNLRLMYPDLRAVGLSATPYRLDSGWLHKGKDAFFESIVFEVQVQGLIDQGYLAPVRTPATHIALDTSTVGHVGKEFNAGQLEEAATAGDYTAHAVRDLIWRGATRKKWLIFCTGAKHAAQVSDFLGVAGIPHAVVLGDSTDRAESLVKFSRGELRALVAVNVLTTGYNEPGVDLIAMLRPTESCGLYVQIVGRGMRRAPGKEDCLILDYAGNVMRHGPIDDVSPDRKGGDGTGAPPAKECPQCEMIIHAAARHCPYCGFEFPEPEPKIERKPTARAILKADVGPTEMDVTQTFYEVHKKYGRPDSVKISYWCGIQLVREWVFPESGSDRGNWSYVNFCRKAGIKNPPRTAQEFVALCPDGPVKIWTMPDGKWTKVVRRQYAD